MVVSTDSFLFQSLFMSHVEKYLTNIAHVAFHVYSRLSSKNNRAYLLDKWSQSMYLKVKGNGQKYQLSITLVIGIGSYYFLFWALAVSYYVAPAGGSDVSRWRPHSWLGAFAVASGNHVFSTIITMLWLAAVMSAGGVLISGMAAPKASFGMGSGNYYCFGWRQPRFHRMLWQQLLLLLLEVLFSASGMTTTIVQATWYLI